MREKEAQQTLQVCDSSFEKKIKIKLKRKTKKKKKKTSDASG
jgi:hypothetical protein